MAKKYVPDGACLVCNKGVGFGKLKVTNHKNVSIYGQNSATEGDKVSKLNIPSLGVCTITRSVCQPVPLLWSGVQEGVTIGPYRKLLEDSKLSCGIGGQISIYFSVPMAMIAVEKNSREQGKNEVKKLGAKVDDWFKKQFDNAEKMNNAMPGSTIENFKLGVAEGVYGGVKGIGEGLVFLSDLKDKAFDATVDAVTHPTETATAIGQAATNAKDAVVKAKDWVSNTDNLKRVANSVEETGKDAYNWTTTPGNLEKAAQAGYNNSVEKLKQAKTWASKQKPRDWGNYTGRGGFEAALMFTGVGEAKAVVNGAEVANVAAKTGEAANLASKVGEGANLAEKTAEGANLASKASKGKTLGEVVSADVDWNLVRKYVKHLEETTGRKLNPKQIEELKNALRENKYTKLTPAETAKKRIAFGKVKNKLIKQWEDETGQKWPTYKETILDKNGEVYRNVGDKYDAHHVIENTYGGPDEWWNIHPAKSPSEHQGGIHGKGAPSRSLFK
jgi:hypothetical protein